MTLAIKSLATTWFGIEMFEDTFGAMPHLMYITGRDRKSTRLNSSHRCISYAVFCLKKKKTRILSFSSGRLATKSNQIKQLIKNGRRASMQRTFKNSFTSFSHRTRNKTRDCLIRVRNIRALNGRFNTIITHAYSIVIGSKHITLNATGGGFLTASKQFRHGATSKIIFNTSGNRRNLHSFPTRRSSD